MSLHADFLEQARHLARREPRRPRQASLRRSISTAYYALFHLLVHDPAQTLSAGTHVSGMRGLLARAFHHSEMLKASRSFAGGSLPNHIGAAVGMVPIPVELQKTASAFVDLQAMRHSADYDVLARFTREEAIDSVEQAERAFRNWAMVRNDPSAKLYLVSLFAFEEFRR